MENNGFLKNSQIIILGICIAGATVASSVIVSKGMMRIKQFTTEVISVTGSAEKNIVSDYTVWKSEFSRRDAVMTTAYDALKADLKKVQDYLSSKGIAENEITVSQVNTEILYKRDEKGNNTNEIEGYLLRQGIEVRSADVVKVTAVSRESTDLITQGIQFISQAPEYFYTKLAELKVDMLAQATENAKRRAEQMAGSTGNKIGVMRSAKMGVIQITPVNSYEVSDWGTNDTTSLEKKVTAVVRVDYAIKE